jgi:hypothetical protein
MQVSYKAPTDRGVTQLMYVGDDDAVDKALGGFAMDTKTVAVFAAIAAAIWFFSEKQRDKRSLRRHRSKVGKVIKRLKAYKAAQRRK